MIHKVIPLCADDANVTLTTYVQDEAWTDRDAMLVIPGGGYSCVCADREGEPIAMAFMARGVNAFVLNYSVKEKAVFPRPLVEASMAMAYIKAHAEEFHIHPNRIFCVGFSAGGHLAASLGTFWKLPEVVEAAGIQAGENRPAGMILCYAVLTAFAGAHRGSFCNILGKKDPTEEEFDRWSIERHVDSDTVPAYFVHTADDAVVPVMNALVTAQAMSKAKVPFELHIYPHGPHGVALGDWQTGRGNAGWVDDKIAGWVDGAVYWMKHIG